MYRCPYCNPQPCYYYNINTPVGCVCPPTSELTCQSPVCPRRGVTTSTTTISTTSDTGELLTERSEGSKKGTDKG